MASTPQDLAALMSAVSLVTDRPVAERIAVLETVCAELEAALHADDD